MTLTLKLDEKRLRRTPWEPYAYLAPTMILLAILMVVPIVVVISYSLETNAVVTRPSEFAGLDNYVANLSDPVFLAAVGRSVYFAIIVVAVHLILAVAFALLLNTKLIGPRLMSMFRLIFILPWVFTVSIVAVLWRMLLDPHGIVNFAVRELGWASGSVGWLSDPSLALNSVIFIAIWAGYPFFMISVLAGLQSVPTDLYEAATVDGAGWFHRFWHITLPQLKPVLVSMTILDLIWSSQQFALIWMVTGGGPAGSTEVVSTYIYRMAFGRFNFSAAASSAVLILLVSMILAYFYVRHQRARD